MRISDWSSDVCSSDLTWRSRAMATARSRSRVSAVRAIKAASRDPNHAAWRGASPLLSRQCSLCRAGDLRAAGQESIQYTIRLPANDVLQRRIGHLQTRLIGPPTKEREETHTSDTHTPMRTP